MWEGGGVVGGRYLVDVRSERKIISNIAIGPPKKASENFISFDSL